ncbi:MAG: capsule assembly Wzi family protein, partial [bacterium]
MQINKNVQNDPTLLSEVEWQQFEQLKGEFHEELMKSGQSIDIRANEYEPHLFSWQNKDIALHWDGILGQQNRIESKHEVDIGIPKSITSYGLGLRVNIKKSLAIYAEGRSFILSDTDSLANTVFNPSLGLPVTKKALVDITVTDNATSYLVFRLPWFDFEFGRDLVEWGPGYRGNLILSRNANFYDLVKLTFRYVKFKFEYFHAFLNSDKTKYLAGHRMEIRPSKSLQFAVNETVVYGNRSVEFLYFNPFVPIMIAERHLG